MIEVHTDFRPPIKDEYPPGNKIIFEEWFFETFDTNIKTKREYLPVCWTSFYVNNRYGKDIQAMNMLQRMLDGLDKSKQYYAVLQYDDGILNNISHLDIKVFGSGGGRIDYPLPLLCRPHAYFSNYDRTFFANFMGVPNHPIRKRMKEVLKMPKYFIKDKEFSIDDYCRIMAQSVFTLCPRGYGATSFRIMEALQQGSIPVYISDRFIIPHNRDFQDYGVLIGSNDIDRIDEILSAISDEEIKRKRELGKLAWETIFNWEWNRQMIYQNAD